MTSTDAQTAGAAETRRMGAVRNRRRPRLSFGLAPLLALTAAAGLVLVALGDNAARISSGEAQPLFWGGLVVIYMPVALDSSPYRPPERSASPWPFCSAGPSSWSR